MRDIPNPFEDDDVCDEIDIDKVVAVSPDHYVYESYEDIPPIPSPRFLLVNELLGAAKADAEVCVNRSLKHRLHDAGFLEREGKLRNVAGSSS